MEIKITKTTEGTITLKPGDCFKRDGVGYTKIISESQYAIVWDSSEVSIHLKNTLEVNDVYLPISADEFELATKDAVAEYEKTLLKNLSLIKQKDF